MKPIAILYCFLFATCSVPHKEQDSSTTSISSQVATLLRNQVLQEAAWALQQEPITVTAATSPHSAGGKHDFFSEGDYWWPNPVSPDSPYIQRDGMTNPENFVAHRLAMIRFSRIVGALASAYQLTGDLKYFHHALYRLSYLRF
jgi:hypothetical protein